MNITMSQGCHSCRGANPYGAPVPMMGGLGNQNFGTMGAMLMQMMGMMMSILQVGLMGQVLNGGVNGGSFAPGMSPGFGASGGGGTFNPGTGTFLGGGPPAAGATSGGAATAGPTSSGPVAPGTAGMLDRARSMLGLHEGRDRARIQEVTGKSGINPATTPWCAAFAMNLLEEHGVLKLDGLSNRNYCPTIKDWASKKGIYARPGQYQPKPGDAIMFDLNKSNGRVDHVGIVEKVENGYVHTIEGNASNSVKRNRYPLNSSKIDGYVVTGQQQR